ncbi:ROK family protein [Halopseudomonas salina]|nr:ROK family protein [Halopseudomonas salina]
MTTGILAVDIGGLSIKAAVLDIKGHMLTERLRIVTPHPCPPDLLLDLVTSLTRDMPAFNRISVGFPGVVRQGRVLTAANLQSDEWIDFELAKQLSVRLGNYPTRVINDADMIGFALIDGVGLEIVVTLGTGFGTAIFRDGDLMPHMELAHHPIAEGRTYDQYLGDAELKKIGSKTWNERLALALALLNTLFHPDQILLGGGNARYVSTSLPANTRIVSEARGISGGAALWREYPPLPDLSHN